MEEAATVGPEEVRKWLRKMYTCQWSYTDAIITIICDDEEFMIDPEKLDQEEKQMLDVILSTIDKDPVI